MKILCLCPIGIGNYLLCYPSWVHLIKNLHGVELHLLALRKQIHTLAASDSLWTKVHFIEPTKNPSLSKIISFISTLRSYRFDLTVSFFPANNWQYNLLPFLCNSKKRYVFRYHQKSFTSLSWLATHRYPVNPTLHDVDQNLSLASFITTAAPKQTDLSNFPDLITDSTIKSANTLLSTNRRVFALHPGSSSDHGMDAKRWAPERFGMLADRICHTLNATALIVGGPDEATLKKTTAAAMTMPHRIIEPLPLPLTAALLKRCTLCLCNDSGIMHLAACNGVPTAALFGPTDEKRNGPYGPNHCILRKEVPGFPLWTAANVGKRRLPAGIDPNRSLKELTVEDAWEQIQPILTQINV